MGMRTQTICLLAITASALLIALGCLCSGAHATANRLRERPQSLENAPGHLVKCAGVSEGQPCFPDPGMQRLQFPQPLPFIMPPEFDPPQFLPSR